MGTSEDWRAVIERVWTEQVRVPVSHGAITLHTVFDRSGDHHLVMAVGWNGSQRVHAPLLHADIVDGKVWIQYDGTESGIASELVAADPTNPTVDLDVVAVLTDVLWQTSVTDAVYLSGQLSTVNRQAVALLTYNTLVNIEVVFQFTVFDYDPVAKRYVRTFHCNGADMRGLLEKRGDELNLSVADDASTEVQSPENYSFNIGIEPQPDAQTLLLATGDQKNFVKAVGPQGRLTSTSP